MRVTFCDVCEKKMGIESLPHYRVRYPNTHWLDICESCMHTMNRKQLALAKGPALKAAKRGDA